MIYCMLVPAYDPVKPTKLVRLSVKNVTITGGDIANNGNMIRLCIKLYDSNLDISRNNVWRLLRNVIAIIGKLADKVNTGNNARKYSTDFSKIDV